METPSYTGPPQPLESKGGLSSSDYNIIGLLWTLLTTCLSAYYGKEEHLRWTPWLILLPGAIGIFVIWRNQRYSLKGQVIILLLSTIAMAVCPYLETEFLLSDRTPEQEAAPAAAEVSVESLEEVSFSGFRTSSMGKRSFVLLTIDEIERQPYRVTFRYSLNEGLVLYRGQGLVYPSTYTLQLADGTLFRYRQEGGIIKLLAWNRDGYELSQTLQK